ncbi:Transposase [Abditibacterium utsteinense]|uniref:Transposase n=1 Tax=Abditibacterium utsteinense TaxID=1960156 RepID=A0A2S8SV12_9BACT|nr:Transposase [Abditibacterium utsteinense]
MGVQRRSSKRKQYTAEFKREAVRLVTEGGLSMAQVARDLSLWRQPGEPLEKGSAAERAARFSRPRPSSG